MFQLKSEANWECQVNSVKTLVTLWAMKIRETPSGCQGKHVHIMRDRALAFCFIGADDHSPHSPLSLPLAEGLGGR